VPPLAVGAGSAAAALTLGRETMPADLAAAITGLGAADPADTVQQVSVATSYCSERTVASTFSPVLGAPVTPPAADDPSPAGSGGGHSNLQQQLDLVARCVKGACPPPCTR